MDVIFVQETKRVAGLRDPPISGYSFVEDDYPPYLPFPSESTSVRRPVTLAFEESVHYGLTSPESTLEWAYTGAAGDSNIRLGPNHRFFNTGFSYQLHCSRFLVSTFQQEPPASPALRAHVSRCLNVIRQFVLCSADSTLEPANAMARNFTAVRASGQRQCRNWPLLYDTMEENWRSWRSYQQVEHS
ncbi:hypothetical protein C8Q74DRAFT_1373409 [Fomes fomentarius]|nr:hypothetical protein C8Q74DRAFT_1373409 [Fomes fomentarius]